MRIESIAMEGNFLLTLAKRVVLYSLRAATNSTCNIEFIQKPYLGRRGGGGHIGPGRRGGGGGGHIGPRFVLCALANLILTLE